MISHARSSSIHFTDRYPLLRTFYCNFYEGIVFAVAERRSFRWRDRPRDISPRKRAIASFRSHGSTKVSIARQIPIIYPRSRVCSEVLERRNPTCVCVCVCEIGLRVQSNVLLPWIILNWTRANMMFKVYMNITVSFYTTNLLIIDYVTEVISLIYVLLYSYLGISIMMIRKNTD